ncbi:nucleoside triphosphate pyrophosphohydrolase family protein [Acidovorax sp. FHTAMBA]|uniref:nucleoside triphosphate pyrophosphohydrolase family protein n=1 Tax=Acidovorax sp. FHTAMBA TaxID=3140252 RepID=UPI0031834CA5
MSPLQIKEPPLTVAEYFERAGDTDRFGQMPDGLTQLGFGLFGEVGGLLAALKKSRRDKLKEPKTQIAGEEIGDALWYLVSLATHRSVAPDVLATSCMMSLRDRLNEAPLVPKPGVTFEEIDGLVEVHHAELQDQKEKLLRALAGSCGQLTEHTQEELEAFSPEAVAKSLGGLMAQLALIAYCFELELADIARENLGKIRDRWPGKDPEFNRLFDATNCEEYERFPRQFEIEFVERQVGSRKVVVQRMGGVNIGDPLTDNSNVPDGYSFHDVFHLSYVAHLGWSPVMRALLKLKRKSRSEIDENEDGARAIIIEEGIATWIFNHAKERKDFFEGVARGELEFGLLKQVRSMVTGYEVAECPTWQWEIAILRGFEVFRQLKSAGRGIVKVDMENRSLEFVLDREVKVPA